MYLSPSYEEYELRLDREGYEGLMATIRDQTQKMRSFCGNAEDNIPLPHEMLSHVAFSLRLQAMQVPGALFS